MKEDEAIDPEILGNGKDQKMAIQRAPTEIDLSSVEAIERQALKVEKYMEVQARIRRACIKLTNVHDWVDQDGKPYLQWTGAAKVAGAFGVSYDTPRFSDPKVETDEAGTYLNFEVQTLVRYAGRSVPEIGTASTRDSFFGVRSVWNEVKKEKEKIYLPLSEIDINDIKKKALTNLLNRGLKSLLGLSFTWEEIIEATNGAITPEKCSQVKHLKGTQGGGATSASTADARSKVWKQLLELADGEIAVAEAKLREYTVWTNKENKQVPGKSKITEVSDAMMKHLEPKVQAAYDEFLKGLNKANPGKAAS